MARLSLCAARGTPQAARHTRHVAIDFAARVQRCVLGGKVIAAAVIKSNGGCSPPAARRAPPAARRGPRAARRATQLFSARAALQAPVIRCTLKLNSPFQKVCPPGPARVVKNDRERHDRRVTGCERAVDTFYLSIPYDLRRLLVVLRLVWLLVHKSVTFVLESNKITRAALVQG